MRRGFDEMFHHYLSSAEFSGSEVYEGEQVRGRNPVTDFFYAYWCGKCPAGGVPSRSDIRPEELRRYLPHAVLFDVREERGAFQDFCLRVRLMGTHIVEAYGELTGKGVADMANTEAAQRIYSMAALVRETQAPVLNYVRGYARERQHMDAYALYMPLSETGEGVTMIFAAGDVRLSARTD